MNKYQEIKALQNIYIKNKVEINFSTTDFLSGNKDFRLVEFKLKDKTFHFYVEDEIDDIKYNYPLLNLCLVLRELEGFDEAQGYLSWCQERYLDPKNEKILANYRNLSTIYREVEKIIGKISSHISNWDFEIGSGAAWELRKKGLT